MNFFFLLLIADFSNFGIACWNVCVGLFASHFVTADEQLQSDLFTDIKKASEKCHPKIPPLSLYAETHLL